MKTKRIPTDEQKARAAERREKFGAFCKQLAEMSDAARVELCASVGAVLSCEGRQLSDINTALLVMQYGGRGWWARLTRIGDGAVREVVFAEYPVGPLSDEEIERGAL